ncbi:WD40-repeat-containing domain protein [Syncephalis fuscata]|nr:WD40-repeat-containing domain protein [Syncephalis fuscata]
MVLATVESPIMSQDGGDDPRHDAPMADSETSSNFDSSNEYLPYSCSERVMTCEFCPIDAGQDLLAWGGVSQLEIIRRNRKQKNIKSTSNWTWISVARHLIGGRVVRIAWSPETKCSLAEKGELIINIKLAVITGTQQLHVIENDSQSVHRIGSGGSDINDLVWCPSNPNQLATVGEDHLCHLWSITAAHGLQKLSTVSLSSPGVAVCWHPTDVGCLMVAERLGYIRLLDCSQWDSDGDGIDGHATKIKMHWRLTLTAPRNGGPLTGASWKPQDRTIFGAIVGDRWYTWDLSDFKKLLPDQSGEAHSEGAGDFKWSPAHPNLFATFTKVPKPFNALRCYDTNYPQVPQSYTLPTPAPLRHVSWHAYEPLLVGCANDTLYFWTVSV